MRKLCTVARNVIIWFRLFRLILKLCIKFDLKNQIFLSIKILGKVKILLSLKIPLHKKLFGPLKMSLNNICFNIKIGLTLDKDLPQNMVP